MAETITASDFKNGATFIYEGKLVRIEEFQHVKPGKGAAFVRAKIRNIVTGGVVETTFRPVDKFDVAYIERMDMQYLYNDGDLYYFMNPETYEQIPVGKDVIGDAMKFVKDNDECKVCSHDGKVFAIEPPISVELEVTETEPAVAGNTATNVTKPATVETGAVVTVPAFIEQGERIKIDTRTGEYTSRA